jgi:hypothetical protein
MTWPLRINALLRRYPKVPPGSGYCRVSLSRGSAACAYGNGRIILLHVPLAPPGIIRPILLHHLPAAAPGGRLEEPGFGWLADVLRWPQSKRDSPRPLCPSSFNTGSTEDLSDLRVDALLCTEDTEGPLTCGETLITATTSARADLRWKNGCSADL